MPRITRVTTRTGDAGDTALATGQRVRKDHPRIEAYGTVDELASVIGMALASDLEPGLAAPLAAVQNDLFHLGAELATPLPASGDDGETRPGPRIEQRHVDRLEGWQDEVNRELPPLANFVLPGGSPAAAQLQVARAVCRRAERRVVTLAAAESVRPEVVRYLNRLSDLLFTFARGENQRKGVAQPVWDSRA